MSLASKLIKNQQADKRVADQKRLDEFLKAQEALEKQYGIQLIATLQYNDLAVVPIVKARVMPLEPKNAESKTTEESPQ